MSNEETLNQAMLLGTYETIAFDERIEETYARVQLSRHIP